MSRRMLVLLAVIQICLLYKSVDGLNATVCEGGYLPLACPPDSFISIKSAMYGRLDKTICPFGNISNTTCSTNRTTLSALQALCNGQRDCDVNAMSYFFGEPCAGIFKYLTFEYTCSPCVNTNGDDAECEMWALDGECNGPNYEWMGQYCSKACFKCEAAIDSTCTNVGDDKECTLMASKGNCTSNPAYMGAYCKKACKLCDQPTVCVNKANETECKTRNDAQECSKNFDYMLANCSKTCFNCTDTIKCVNQNEMCDEWAMQGKCQSDPGKMMSICTKSCLGCSADPVCANIESDCDYWASIGECKKNPVWMYRTCWKSCSQCPTSHVCDNTMDDALCDVWFSDGECSINPVYMQDKCRLSCTRCKPLGYGRSKCINALFNDTLCSTYAQQGECSKNPGFMLKYCYKTCTSCYFPYSIGNNAVAGKSLDVTGAYTYRLPYQFGTTAVLDQFTAFFTYVNPTYFQVWRLNSTDYSYYQIHSQLFIPLASNEAQNIKVTKCVIVNSTDIIGFTNFYGPSPIAATLTKVFNSVEIREAAAVGQRFSSITTPFVFAVSAQFTPGTLC